MTMLGVAVPAPISRGIAIVATTLLALLTLAGVEPAHASVDTGAISGTVSAPVGADADWYLTFSVSAHNVNTDVDYSAAPDVDGNYLLSGLEPGDYVVIFGPNPWAGEPAYAALPVYYPGTYDADAADVVTVEADATTAGIDGQGSYGGGIAGTVTAPEATDADWWRAVEVQASGPTTTSVALASDGTFAIGHLQPGEYEVSFVVGTYDVGDGPVTVDLESQDYPEPVEVTDGAATGAIDAALAPAPDQPFTTAPDPQIPSAAVFGDTLTVTEGGWDPTPATFTYQWYSGPTARGTESTYAVGVADIGQPIRVEVTAHRDGYVDTTVSSNLVVPGLASFSGGTVTVTGTPAVGETLSASLSGANPEPSGITWEWRCDGTPIDGADANSHVVTAADAGCNITAVATFSSPGYTDGTATSDTAHVPSFFVGMPGASIPITATFGDTLSVSVGTWDPEPDSLTYQWLRDATEVSTGATYTLQPADVGQAISVKVTAHKVGYAHAVATSNTVVPAAAAFSGGTVTVTGTPAIGVSLHAGLSGSAPAPTTVAWQWQCNGSSIDGAVGNSYVVTAADAGCTLTAVATFSTPGYADGTATSNAVHVPSFFGGTPTVSIPSTATFGDTLSVTNTGWNPAPDSLTYQWLRGSTEVGTAATYTLQPADVGQAISVKVTGHKAGYFDSTITSNSVTPVAATFTGASASIVGTATEGNTLTASLAGVTPAPDTVSWQWTCNSVPISGATTATHDVTGADAECSLKVTATFSKPGYTTAAATSLGKSTKVNFFNSHAPTIPSAALPGDVLTVDTGGWSPAPSSYDYQWLRDGETIVGAQAASYTVLPGDVGKELTVLVTYYGGFYYLTKDALSNAVIPSLPPLAPGTPTITGTPVVGSSLTAREGTWPAGVSYTYTWLRDDTPISGQTSRIYTAVPADAGHTISVKVTGSRSGFANTSATAPGVTIATAQFAVPTLPSFSGTYGPGKVLTAATGTWNPSPTAFAYQWYRNGVEITDATGGTYTISADDAGAKISLGVTGARDGYETITKNSAQITIPLFFSTTPAPTVSGTLRAGYTLAAKPGTWAPTASFSYQWYRNGVKITGATSSSYKLTTTDRGRHITVVVTGKRSGYASVPMTSAAKTIYYEFSKAPNPTISGTLRAGSTLAANPGTWSPTPTRAYQWYRNGVAIAGATSYKYKLTTSDKGKKITVRVTATRSGYLTLYRWSAAKTVSK